MKLGSGLSDKCEAMWQNGLFDKAALTDYQSIPPPTVSPHDEQIVMRKGSGPRIGVSSRVSRLSV